MCEPKIQSETPTLSFKRFQGNSELKDVYIHILTFWLTKFVKLFNEL